MIATLKRLGGDSLLYALMNVGTKLIAFLMLPIYTHYLNPAQMGAFEMMEALTSVLTFIIIFGTDNSLAFYFYDTDEPDKRLKLFRAGLQIRLIIVFAIILLFASFNELVGQLLFNSQTYQNVIFLGLLVLLLDTLVTLVLTHYRFSFQVRKVAIFTVLKLLMVAIFSYLFLRFFMNSVDSIFLGRALASAIIIVFLLGKIKSFVSIRLDKKLILKLIKYGAPLVPASIAFWVITFSNRFFLSHFETLSTVGIYGVAIKFATVISLLTSSVQMAWRPYSMSIKNNENAKETFVNIFYFLMISGNIFLLVVSTFVPSIMGVVVSGEAYKDSTHYIALLSVGSFLSFYYLIISVGLFITEKTKVLTTYVLISAVGSVILNILLIPIFSIWGAVASLIISYLIVNILIFNKSQQFYKLPTSGFGLLLHFSYGISSIIAITWIQVKELNNLYILFIWLIFIFASFSTSYSRIKLIWRR
ncbi:oligosaccharide flippase family protein [Rossellomorea sp. SC111]|uniref:oligosaccharide flippase family protein n=1 Tax=Rossellomorea sp. SC111 TaxID=2968985 RepID=UPI00215A7953|nr:oligosaccharide flippase family protein [Rossellomorea sp. SC111]MCR8850561.1 oligosaccharide flippase family protein [Rossellomorea sp. SC111]